VNVKLGVGVSDPDGLLGLDSESVPDLDPAVLGLEPILGVGSSASPGPGLELDLLIFERDGLD